MMHISALANLLQVSSPVELEQCYEEELKEMLSKKKAVSICQCLLTSLVAPEARLNACVALCEFKSCSARLGHVARRVLKQGFGACAASCEGDALQAEAHDPSSTATWQAAQTQGCPLPFSVTLACTDNPNPCFSSTPALSVDAICTVAAHTNRHS